MLKYISDSDHYTEVISQVKNVKQTLWIGTADIKDLYVEIGKEKKPFLALIAQLIRKGVEVRLIHAKEPGQAFREDFDKYPTLYDGLERVLCPRVHFKMIVLDCQKVYVGSANLTGAGIGMKADTTRNFEAGILTDEPVLVEAAMNQFDDVWMGKMCKKCKRKEFCGDPIE
ncbi:MAG: phospholipase D-like domain-containing protein [Bacteroidaceae bacterium]|nr:phospholipase D-like domain-containing protein [Bacteroidaceae bacterium]